MLCYCISCAFVICALKNYLLKNSSICFSVLTIEHAAARTFEFVSHFVGWDTVTLLPNQIIIIIIIIMTIIIIIIIIINQYVTL